MGEEAPGMANAFSHLDASGIAPEMLVMMERLDRNAGTLRLGEWAFDLLDIQPGESVLDAGCGIGFDTVRLATRTGPGGSVLGLDFSDAMITAARSRLTAETAQIAYTSGDVTQLDLPDASFDVVHCERVLQHLVDPGAAIAELIRVLKPGGRIAILDTDGATSTSSAGTDEVAEIVLPLTGMIAKSRRIGRQLPSRMVGAGLSILGVEASAVMLEPEAALNPPFTLLPQMAAAAGYDTAVVQGWVDEVGEHARGGYLVQAVTMIGVVARKP